MVSPVRLAFIQSRYLLVPDGRVAGIVDGMFEAAGVVVGEKAGGVVVRVGRGMRVVVLAPSVAF